MQPPIFVRPLTVAERQRLQAGLRSPAACTVRRCQILLARANGLRPVEIARNLACAKGTVLDALHACERDGLDCLQEQSSRPHSARPLWDESFTDPLKDLLPHSPRLFGQPTGVWTLPLLATVCHARGWTPRPLSDETIRQALQRLSIHWRRAKHWSTSPDPAYARKKTARPANPPGANPSELGLGLPG